MYLIALALGLLLPNNEATLPLDKYILELSSTGPRQRVQGEAAALALVTTREVSAPGHRAATNAKSASAVSLAQPTWR